MHLAPNRKKDKTTKGRGVLWNCSNDKSDKTNSIDE